ncbi:unnamed protein product [Acanthoscelides obtectus]|nr:unnamed protein product [Acanthoscelides obtectus]CAK1673449.1 Gephyrin [Acanthoscelides obtectus]
MSPYPMVSVKEASQTIFKYCTPVHDTEAVPFEQAINRILAENVVTPEPVPAFRASIKDGYAVKSSDGAGRRKIKQATVAGDKPIVEELQDGEAVRISTGAPVPPGADAVVQVEDTKLLEANEDETEEISIEILKAPVANQDIRDIGSDCEKGYIVLSQFNRMGPAHVGVLAQLAKKEVKVFRKPTIGILSTGNELKEPWEKIEPGQIRDSNRYTLKHLLNRYHYDSTDCGMVKDDPSEIKQALEKALDENEFVITTGGASMGELDVVKRVLQEDFEARIHFGRINIKPGKPTSFATLSYKGKIKKVFCLPGNPASCTVCAIIFIIPVLRYIENEKVFQFPLLRIPLSQRLVNTDSRPDYLRVKVTTGLGCEPKIVLRRNQISSNLTSFCNANGLIIVPPQQHQEEELEGEELDLTRFVVPNPSHTFAPTASHTFAPTPSHAGQQTPPNRPRALLGPTPVIQTIVDDRPKYTVIMFEQIVRPPPQ